MPDWSSLLAGSEGFKQLTQYPDVGLYNAAAKMKPEHRPTVPVRLYDDPEPVYKEFGSKPNPLATAVVGPKKDKIYVNRKSNAYGNRERLAGVLAHEQRHVEGGDEIQAKLRELEVLEALTGRWKSNPRLKELRQFKALFGK